MSVFHEWEYEDEDGKTLVLTLTTTDEGIVLDVFDERGEESILTEAMTVSEWIDWMQNRDRSRRQGGN